MLLQTHNWWEATVPVELPGGVLVYVQLPMHKDLDEHAMKRVIWAEVMAHSTLRHIMPPHATVDHYEIATPGTDSWENSEWQNKGDFSFWEFRRPVPQLHRFRLLPRAPPAASQAEKRLKLEIGSLIGRPLSYTTGNDEVTAFRASMSALRASVDYTHADESLAVPVTLTAYPLPEILRTKTLRCVFTLPRRRSARSAAGAAAAAAQPSTSAAAGAAPPPSTPDKKVVAATAGDKKEPSPTKGADKGGDKEKGDSSPDLDLLVSDPIQVPLSLAADKLLAHLLKHQPQWLPTGKKPGDYLVKVRDFAEFITGKPPLSSFEMVRRCLLKDGLLHLSLVERSTHMKDFLRDGDRIAGKATQAAGGRGDDGGKHERWAVTSFRHEDITTEGRPPGGWDRMVVMSILDLNSNFRLRVVGVDRLRLDFPGVAECTSLYLLAGIYYGGELITPLVFSGQTPVHSAPRWQQWLSFEMKMKQMPREARLCLTVFASGLEQDVALGWVNVQLIDYRNNLLAGLHTLHLWPDARANPIGTTVDNRTTVTNPPLLHVEFDTYPLPVVFPIDGRPPNDLPPPLEPSVENAVKLTAIISRDPLHIIRPNEKDLLWEHRTWLVSQPRALAKFLRSVDWSNREHVVEAERLLKKWSPLTPPQALELLDARYASSIVREYAVSRLQELTDSQLMDYLLQLVQVLKYEHAHDSPLARFLLQRSLQAPLTVGHSFFWHLKAELHVPEIQERFELLLEAYLRGCGRHRAELLLQAEVLGKLTDVARGVKKGGSMKECGAILKRLLSGVHLPPRFRLPLSSSFQAAGLLIEECRVMDSKKLPLWLTFANADPAGAPLQVILKVGDDMRQDLLTLQMFQLMSRWWLDAGLDLLLIPYRAVATGDSAGMLEVVTESETISRLQKSATGSFGAFSERILHQWLQKCNPGPGEFERAVDAFVRSCAGACVASYVVGLGDRHNDNIMLQRSGVLFHIDFGHFLGNIKTFAGVSRERCPFVFTPDFAFVMGRKGAADYERFEQLCAKAFNVLRGHAGTFTTLFILMLSTGIPELQGPDDIVYLRDALVLELTEEQAAARFTDLIGQCLNTKATQLNFLVHNLVH